MKKLIINYNRVNPLYNKFHKNDENIFQKYNRIIELSA